MSGTIYLLSPIRLHVVETEQFSFQILGRVLLVNLFHGHTCNIHIYPVADLKRLTGRDTPGLCQ
jgi:hypothetical protein